MWSPAAKMVLLIWMAMLVIIERGHGSETEKKIVIHVPTSVKHIHHHHTNKVLVKSKGQHGQRGHGSFHVMEHGKPSHDWLEDHVQLGSGHEIGSHGHEELLIGKGIHGIGHGDNLGGESHGRWRQAKTLDIVGSRSNRGGLKHIDWYSPSLGLSTKKQPLVLRGLAESSKGKDSGTWSALKHHHLPTPTIKTFAPIKTPSYEEQSDDESYEAVHKYVNQEEPASYGGHSGGKYEVNEDFEDEEAPGGGGYNSQYNVQHSSGGWRGIENDYENKRPQHSTNKPVSSYEVKGHKGTSYSSVVIHNSKSRRHI